MSLCDIIIFEPSERLCITKEYKLLSIAADGDGDLEWNKDGEVRVINHPQLVNAISLYRDYQKQIECGRFDEVPLAARFLFWHETSPRLPYMNFRLDPAPR